MPVKDEHKKTLEQHSQGNKFIDSSHVEMDTKCDRNR